ncbi:MAG: tRNA lysidine(34) synthetase TilS, partial [Bacteroidales bacterium]|nr:tRNA lysidine(34) synthetase TilS [Bacteroidales bacterium]
HFLKNKEGKQLLFEWVRKYGFNYTQSESMYEAMMNGKSGVVFYNDNGQETTDNSLIASVQKDRIEIFKNRFDDDEFQIQIDSQILRFSDSQILRFSVLKKDEDFKLIKDSSVAQFDMDKIAFPLKLRRWKKGDRFRPLGMKGSKLLSDFFNDLGFSTYQKQKVWIMEDANGLILWVVGYRISDKVKISDSTEVIFQCDLKS